MESKDLSQIIQDLTKSVDSLMDESVDICKFVESELKSGAPIDRLADKICRVIDIHKDLRPVFQLIQELSPCIPEMMTYYDEMAAIEPFIAGNTLRNWERDKKIEVYRNSYNKYRLYKKTVRNNHGFKR